MIHSQQYTAAKINESVDEDDEPDKPEIGHEDDTGEVLDVKGPGDWIGEDCLILKGNQPFNFSLVVTEDEPLEAFQFFKLDLKSILFKP